MSNYRLLLHRDAVRKFCRYINFLGSSTEIQKENNCPFDVLVDSKLRCEIKSATPRTVSGRVMWQFNLHRHNRVCLVGTDFYALYISGFRGFKYGTWLIIPYSEVPGRKKIFISERSLIFKWSKWFSRFDLIVNPAD